jgi:hypothetical protein
VVDGATVEVDEVLESQFLELRKGSLAAPTGLAMHHHRGFLVEFRHRLRKLLAIEVGIERSLEVPGLEFLRRAHVQHDHFLLLRPFHKLPRRGGIHMEDSVLDRFRGGRRFAVLTARGNHGKGGNEKNGC